MPAKIESYVTPRFLYRYRSIANGRLKREVNNIKNKCLYASTLDKLNDPMEGGFSCSMVVRGADNYRTIRDDVISKKQQLRVCSFSEVYNHELMWAHYADEFRGICIAYDFAVLRDSISNNKEFVRVYYNEEQPIIDRTPNSPEEDAKRVLSYKNQRWLYEREWRMFSTKERNSYSKEAVVKIFVGGRATLEDREEIKRQINCNNISIKQMTISKHKIEFPDQKKS